MIQSIIIKSQNFSWFDISESDKQHMEGVIDYVSRTPNILLITIPF